MQTWVKERASVPHRSPAGAAAASGPFLTADKPGVAHTWKRRQEDQEYKVILHYTEFQASLGYNASYFFCFVETGPFEAQVGFEPTA